LGLAGKIIFQICQVVNQCNKTRLSIEGRHHNRSVRMSINRRNLRRQHSTDGRLESALFEEVEEAKPSYRASQRIKYAKHPPKVVKIELHFVVPPVPKCLLVVIALLCILYGLLSSLAFLEFPEGTAKLPSVQHHNNNDRFSMKRNGRVRSVESTEAKFLKKGNDRKGEVMVQNRPSDNIDSLARIPLPKPVRLLRIPKAGSSSFSAFLRYQYNCTSAEYPPGDCTKHNRLVCGVIDGCYNHKPVPDWKNDPRRPAMITFVREPVARYISAYQYKGHHGFVCSCLFCFEN
jgi:Sulfotransferase family